MCGLPSRREAHQHPAQEDDEHRNDHVGIKRDLLPLIWTRQRETAHVRNGAERKRVAIH